MKPIRVVCLIPCAAVLAAFFPQPATAQSPKAELDAITANVKMKMQKGMISEADLALELNQLSDLLIRHRGEKTEEVAAVLLTQALVYADVIGDREMGVVLLKRLKYEFRSTEAAKVADPLIESIQSGERYKGRRPKVGPPQVPGVPQS